jgi:thiol-disulfide isomerase/thioredoxin
MNKKNKFILAGVIALVVIAIILIAVLGSGSAKPNPALDAFAQCLASKEVTMYGAYWCPHCQNEKKAFGDSFQYVPYVECTQDVARCTAMNIDGYPTWILKDGKRLIGEQGLYKLSQESGCPLTAPAAQQ